METLREFLESTTIHGLSRIASSKSKPAKVGWLLVVIFGFGIAGFVIHSSFSEWDDSPVSTTITSCLVADLPFPNVTICPPKEKGMLHCTVVYAQTWVSAQLYFCLCAMVSYQNKLFLCCFAYFFSLFPHLLQLL